MNAIPSPIVSALAPFARLPRWVAWRNEDRKGKTTKVPYGDGGQHAKADDPMTWLALPDAHHLAGKIVNGHGGGVGIELGDLGDGRVLAGIDLDSCVAGDGSVAPWAAAVLQRIGSYAEISPSGSGIKVFFTFAAADLSILRAMIGDKLGRTFRAPGGGAHGPAIELHLGLRYYTVTGEVWGAMTELRHVSAEVVRWIIAEAGPALARKPAGAKTAAAKARSPRSDAPDDTAPDPGILERLDTLARHNPAVARALAGLAGQSSRSEAALALAGALRRAGWDYESVSAAVRAHPATAEWATEKGAASGSRELQRVWDKAGEDAPAEQPDPDMLANPDMAVLRLGRRAPPALPLDVFGPEWSRWICDAAEAAGAPPDYVVVPLLAAASALIGHARWPQAWPGWCEPPHIWAAAVGDSGSSKSPGADCLLRDVLPVIEDRMQGDFPDRLADWRAKAEAATAAAEQWKSDVRTAQKSGHPPPLPPAGCTTPEPQAPRLRQSDVTIERVATLLAHAAPKGLLIVRDELAGWLQGLNAYNEAGRILDRKLWRPTLPG